jgi:hypothetical protein
MTKPQPFTPLKARVWKSSRSGMWEWAVEDSYDCFDHGWADTKEHAQEKADESLAWWKSVETEGSP